MDFTTAKAIAYSSQFYMDDERLRCLYDAALSIQVTGDVVECGVANGCSAAILAAAVKDSKRALWLYDSWQSMPPPNELDGDHAAEVAGQIFGSPEHVEAKMQALGIPTNRIVYRKGWFSETFNQPLPEAIALLHIDCDWQQGTIECLEVLYDRVPQGGIIVLDDFGYFEGVVHAFYEFCCRRSIHPLLQPASRWQALWVKGKLHNRDSYPF